MGAVLEATSPKRVLFLGPPESPVAACMEAFGDHVLATQAPLTPNSVARHRFDVLVSSGYRHLVRPAILNQFPFRAVNLHIALLPWNRGAHPNVWGFYDDTPKGVTIHLMDAGLDTGPIIAQRSVELDAEQETLSSSYARLQREMESLFAQWWPRIRLGDFLARRQTGSGTLHRVRDLEGIQHLLTEGWNTPASTLVKAGHQARFANKTNPRGAVL